MTDQDTLATRVAADLQAAGLTATQAGRRYHETFSVQEPSGRALFRRILQGRQQTVNDEIAARLATILGTEPARYVFTRDSRRADAAELADLMEAVEALEEWQMTAETRLAALEEDRASASAQGARRAAGGRR